MNFMFSWQEQYLTRSLRSLVRYCSCHSNIKFISSRHRVIFSIHTLDKFSYIATFYKLECLSQYLVHFSTYQVTFQTRPCIFSTKPMIFCLYYSDHWSRPGSPPSPTPRHRSLCRSGWFFSPLCFKRKRLPAPSHMRSAHFKWSVMKFLIVWFDQNLWLPDHKDSGH